VGEFHLQARRYVSRFKDLQSGERAGFAELIVPPLSPMIGKTLREIEMRKHYGVEPILLLKGDREERGDFSDQPFQAGEAIVVHGRWANVRALGDNINFVVLTPMEAAEAAGEAKPVTAALCFAGAVGLALSGVPLSLGLLTGALAMIVLRVVPIDEAYRAVDWRTVFLLAGLIPLGIAMEKTGAAAYVADQVTSLVHGNHTIFLMVAVAVLSSLFSLFMSNVAATVLLVPLVMVLGDRMGVSPRGLALLVGISASNSFVLPTHQVNALLISPGGYRNADYLRAGGVMTLIFIVVAVGMIYAMFV
jgi:di/tricarboxylate transporter